MSRTVDDRVVSMQFDNRHFESNVQTSLSTLDKLKQSLKFPDSTRGFDNINAAAKRCNLTPLSDSVDAVRLKFSALDVMAVTCLTNITNEAYNAGKKIAKALFTDPIKTGFQEYETQINSVQTILANTQSKGTTLDQVNQALDTLNTYADKTIYNFTEMTRNIGTFTAAGVELDTAVNSIQGIANLAAVSGSSAQQASTAMYQLSQALAAGTVKLMDWNSVVNAGMGGQVFQDALKETARVHGIAIDDMIEKQGSFRETLSEGWLTSEILTETLEKFTATTEGLTDAQIEANRQMWKAKGYSDKQIDSIFKLGETATDAATKVKTATQLWDTLKEAAQSGWTQTWELIVGDFEEAKTLWTGISEVVGGFINKMSEWRNNLLGGALTSKWDKMIGKINEAGVETSKFEEVLKNSLKDHGFDVDRMIERYGSLEEAFQHGAAPVHVLKKALKELKQETMDLSLIDRNLKKGLSGDDVKQAQEALKSLGYDLGEWGVDGVIGSMTDAAIRKFQEEHGLTVDGILGPKTLAAMKEATSITGELFDNIEDLVDGVDKLGGRQLLLEAFGNIFKAIGAIIKPIGEAINEVFGGLITPEGLYGLIEKFHAFTETLKISGDTAERIKGVFVGLFSAFKRVGSIIGKGLTLAFEGVSWVVEKLKINVLDVISLFTGGWLSWALKGFSLLLKTENMDILSLIEKVSGWINRFADTITDFTTNETVVEYFGKLRQGFAEAFEGFGEWVNGLKERFGKFFDFLGSLSFDNFSFQTLGEIFTNFKDNVIGYFTGDETSNWLSGIIKPLRVLKDLFLATFGLSGDNVSGWFEKIKSKVANLEIVKFLVAPFNSLADMLSSSNGGFAGILSSFWNSIQNFVSDKSVIFQFKRLKHGIADVFTGFGDWFGGLREKVGIFFDYLKKISFDNFSFDTIKDVFATFKDVVLGYFTSEETSNWIGGLTKPLIRIKEAFLEIFGFKSSEAGELSWFEALKAKVSNLGIVKFFSGLFESLKNIGSKFKGLISGVIGFISDNMGTIIALGSMLSMVFIFKQIKDSIALLTEPVLLMKNLGNGVTSALKGLSDSMKTFAKAELIKSIGISIGILAASVAVLAMLDQGKVWSAVGAIVVLGAGIVVMTKAMKDVKAEDAMKFAGSMLMIAGSFILMALAAKIIGGMDGGELIQGGVAIAAFVGIVALMGNMSKTLGRGTTAFGKMMLGLAGALLILTLVVRILGGMDTSTLIKGAIAVTYFLGLMVGMMAATRLLAKDIPKFGSMMLALSGSLLIMAFAVRLLGGMDTAKLVKGGIAIAAFLGLMVGMMAATRLLAKDLPKFGATMAGIGTALLLMSGSVLILGNMDTKKLIKGGLALIGLVGIIAGLMAATQLLGKYSFNASKVGDMILGVATSVLMMSASVAMLSMIDGRDLVKALAALTGIGLILSGLIYVTKFAKNLKIVTLIGLSAAIAVMAISVAALAKIDLDKLAVATVGLSAVIGMVALLSKFTASLKPKTLITLGVVTLAIAVLAQIIGKLASIDADSNKVLAAATALTEVVIAIAAVCAVLAIVGKLPLKAIGIGLLAFLGVVAILMGAIYLGISTLPWIADQFSEFGRKIEPFLRVMNSVSPSVFRSAKTLAEAMLIFTGAGALHAFVNNYTWGGVSRAFNSFVQFIKDVLPVVKDFALELSAKDVNINFDNLEAVINAVKGLAEAASMAPSALTAVFTPLGGYLNISGLSSFTKWITVVCPEILKLAGAIDQNGDKVDITDKDLKNLSAMIDAAVSLASVTEKIPKTTIAAGFWGAFIEFTDLSGVANWIRAISPELIKLAAALDEDGNKVDITSQDISNLKAMVDAATSLVEASAGIPKKTIAGAITSFGVVGYYSETDFQGMVNWVNGMKQPLLDMATALDGEGNELDEADIDRLNAMTDSAKKLAEASSNIPKKTIWGALTTVGVIGYYSETDFKGMLAWVNGMKQPLTDMATALADDGTEITQANIDQLAAMADAAKKLAEASANIPKKTFFGSLIFGPIVYQDSADFQGMVDWVKGMKQPLIDMASALNDDGTELSQRQLDQLSIMADTAKKLAEGSKDIPKKTTFGSFMVGYVDAADFMGMVYWVKGIRQPLIDMALALTEDGTSMTLTKQHLSNLDALTGAAKKMAEASANIPKKTIFGGLIFGPFGYMKAADFQGVTDWIREVFPVLQDAALALSTAVGADGKPIDIDTEALGAIVDAVTALAEASGSIPDIGGVVQAWNGTTNFTGFANFVEKFVPTMQDFAKAVSEGDIEIDPDKLIAVASAGKLLAEMTNLLPKEGGIWEWADTDIEWENLKTTFKTMGSALAAFSTEVSGNIDNEAILDASKAGKTLSEMCYNLANSIGAGGLLLDALKTDGEDEGLLAQIGSALVEFSNKVTGIDSTAVSSAAKAALDISQVFVNLSGFDYTTVSVNSFSSKLSQLVTAIKTFETDMTGVDVATPIAQIEALISILTGLATADFTGVNSFKTAMEKLAQTSIDTVVQEFEDGSDDISEAAATMAKNGAEGIKTKDVSTKYSGAGKYVVTGFASGITENTWRAEAKAKAMALAAYEAAKKALAINSPSKIFRSLGTSIPEGLAMGIDMMSGMVGDSAIGMAKTAINDAKNALATVVDVINSDVDAQPTIRPVIDLSDVTDGANRINGMFSMQPSVGVMSNVGVISSMMNARQNGVNSDVISAIERLGQNLGKTGGNTYNVNGVTYDDGSNVSTAVGALIRAIKVEGRK